MKKLLYVSFEDSENRASGVNKKISGQIGVFERSGILTDLIAVYQDNIALYHRKSNPEIIKDKKSSRISVCEWASKNAEKYDVAYIRFQFFCPFVLRMVKAFSKNGVKTVMEIPTYPYNTELRKQGLRGIPKRLIDGTFKRACAKYIDSFAAPLYNSQIMGKPCIEIRNGINVNDVKEKSVVKTKEGIHLLAVAMMAPWHGYDRLIEGIKEYYKNDGQCRIYLHLVGQGVASQEYETLINKYNLSDYVIQHGKLYGEELDEIYNIADIGVGSLGIHRTVIKKTNTLKIMEYMAKGLPVICEPSEVGIDRDNRYRMNVPEDESSIDIFKVIDFYNDIYKNHPADLVINEIRKDCRAHCSVEEGFKEVVNYIRR